MKKSKKILTYIILFSILSTLLLISPIRVSANTNLINKYTEGVVGYVNANNTLITSAKEHYTTNYITVKPGDTVYFGPANPDQGFHLHGYNSSKNIIDSSVSIKKGSANLSISERNFFDLLGSLDDTSNHNFVAHAILAYKVPSGVTSIRIATPYKYNDVFLVTVNQKFNTQDYYDYWHAKLGNTFDNKYGTYFTPKQNPNLYKKSILFVGDSITYAVNKTSLFYDRGWAGRIAAVNSMTYVNAGRRGASLSTKKSNRIITALNENLSKSFDFVIMHGGVNDAWVEAPVGSISTGFNKSSFNTATFAGALEELFYTAKNNAKWKNTKFGFIINYALPNHTEGNTSDMSAYFNVAKKICDKWEIEYLDLYNNYDLNYNILKVNQAASFTSGDFCHIKSQGYDKLHPYIQSWLENLGVEPDDPPSETQKETESQTTKPPSTTEPSSTTKPSSTTEPSYDETLKEIDKVEQNSENASEITSTSSTNENKSTYTETRIITKFMGCEVSIASLPAILSISVLGATAVLITQKRKRK